MRRFSFLVLFTIFISGCGIRGPLYLPETKPAESKVQPVGTAAPVASPTQNVK